MSRTQSGRLPLNRRLLATAAISSEPREQRYVSPLPIPGNAKAYPWRVMPRVLQEDYVLMRRYGALGAGGGFQYLLTQAGTPFVLQTADDASMLARKLNLSS